VTDPYNLQRFLDAQEGVYETALAELRAGAKQSHWMWFIFPQLRGLGLSPTSQYYGIASLDEAHSFLDHPVLGSRQRECVEAMLPHVDRLTPEQILGSVDAIKLKSSLTLFDQVEPNSLFASGLAGFFDGERDQRTLALLNGER
jgi:uncharacterized protein (DUF1810 family)